MVRIHLPPAESPRLAGFWPPTAKSRPFARVCERYLLVSQPFDVQEQTGLYGAIVIAPKAGYPYAFDRDYVVLLSDWSFERPETIVGNL